MFFLCLRLGQPSVAIMMEHMSSMEYVRWVAYFRFESLVARQARETRSVKKKMKDRGEQRAKRGGFNVFGRRRS